MCSSRAPPFVLTCVLAGSVLLLHYTFASAAELSESDCVGMRACRLPPAVEVRSNATVLVLLEHCCFNATQALQLVVASGSIAQNITVSLQHVVVTQLLSLVTVAGPLRNATRFPGTDGWGSLDVRIMDSYLRLSNFGNVVRVESASMSAVRMRMTRTRVRHPGVGLASGLTLRALLAYLERVSVSVVEIAVYYSEVSGITPNDCLVVFLHEVRPFSLSVATTQRQGTRISIEFVHAIVNMSAVSASRKLPQSASWQSVVMINSSSLVGGIVAAIHSIFDVRSVYDSNVIDVHHCNAEHLQVTLRNVSASVMSAGDVMHGHTLPSAIVISCTTSFLIDSTVEFERVNATMTIDSGSVIRTTPADATFADATLLYLYSILNTSVHLRDVFVRSRAIGGDIAPVGGYSSQMMLQLAVVVVNSASPRVDNLSIDLEDVRFDVFVEATASATTIVSRAFLQVVYLVQVAATSTSVSVSVANCHLSRWSSFPDRIMLADSRTMLVVAFIDPYAGAPGAALLTATKSKVSVVNVTVARMDSEWADASLVGLSGTQVGVDVLVRNVTCRSISADSAPPDFRSDSFALFFGPGSTLQPRPIASVLGGALLWSGVVFTGPLAVGGNSVVTFSELSASPLSHFVSKNYMRYGLGTSLFAVSSLSVPHNATFTCHGCVVGSSGSEELHPSPLSAPIIVGLAAPIVGFNVVAENVTFCWPLLAVYFNDSELLNIADNPHSGGSLSFRDSLLTIGCNYHRSWNPFVVEASSTVAALFNVTYVDGCFRRPQPTPAPPPPTPIPHVPPPIVPLMISASTAVSTPAIAAAAIAGDVSSLGSMQALAAFSSAGLCSIEPDDAPNATTGTTNDTTFDTAATSSPPSPSRFSLSPFIDIGFVEVVLGNISLTAAVSLFVFLLSVLRALRTPTLGQEVAAEIETLRHSLFRSTKDDSSKGPLTPTLLKVHNVPLPASWLGRVGGVLSNGSVWHVLHFPSLTMRATTCFLPGVVYGSVSLLSAVAERSPRVSYASGVTAGVAGLLFVAVGFAGVLATQRHVTALVVFRDGDNLGIERLYQRTAFDRWLYWIGFPVAYCAPHRVKETYAAFFGNARGIGLVRAAFAPKLVSLVAVAATAVPAIRRAAASCAAVWFALFALYAGVATCMILTTPLMCRVQCVCAAVSAAVVALSSLTRALVVSIGGFDRTSVVDAMDTAASSVLAATSIVGIAHAVWLRIVTLRAKKRLKDQPCTGGNDTAVTTRKQEGGHVATFFDMLDILLDAHDDGLVSTAVGTSTPTVPPPLQAEATLKSESPIGLRELNRQGSGAFSPAERRLVDPVLRSYERKEHLQKLIETICEAKNARGERKVRRVTP